MSAESCTGTPDSLEHSLDLDSDPEAEQPVDDTSTQSRPAVLLVTLQSSSADPPALPESEPPELDDQSHSLAALNINQSNNTTKTLTSWAHPWTFVFLKTTFNI